jgi:hypothetical protein
VELYLYSPSTPPWRVAQLKNTGTTLLFTHWIGGWVGQTAGLDAVKRKNPIIAPAGNPTPVVQPVA